MIVTKRRGAESDGRERLMDAALALFADRGYDGVAIHEIAEAAGMTRAAPYYHFQNKEDLFLAAVSREMERTAAKLADAVKAAPTFRAQLVAILDIFLMVRGSSVGQFIADVKQNLSPSSLHRFETCHRQTMAILQSAFDQAHANGEFGRVSPRVAFQVFFSLACGYLELARENAEFIQPVDGCDPPTSEVMVDVFLGGIQAHPKGLFSKIVEEPVGSGLQGRTSVSARSPAPTFAVGNGGGDTDSRWTGGRADTEVRPYVIYAATG